MKRLHMKCNACGHLWFPRGRVYLKLKMASEVQGVSVRCPKCNVLKKWDRFKVTKWVERNESRIVECRFCGKSWFPTIKDPKECIFCKNRNWRLILDKK
jgi:Zn finger protein HypA/HybF involved in hydrogenase expression